MANDKHCGLHCQDGTIISSLQRVVGKLGDILHQQKGMRPPSPNVIESTAEQIQNCIEKPGDSSGSVISQFEDIEEQRICLNLAKQIEGALRQAKADHLGCGEVLVPADLTVRIAYDIMRMSENEPCGLRGCVLFLNFEDQNICQKIGRLQCDPNTVATFELSLTLKRDVSSWLGLRHLLPFKACMRKITKGTTVVVSPGYTLVKKKLYRSYQQQQIDALT